MAKTYYFEFEVTLLEVGPRLWRRFFLRHTFSFEELHGAIQMACGWGFSHLYEFRDGGGETVAASEQFAAEENLPTAASVTLKSYFKQPGQECLYIYDFGDNWRHRVKLVQKMALAERFVQRLEAGEGMFPPEDCGGVPGYEDCVRACRLTPAQIKKLAPEERKEILTAKEWLGEWQPEGFDLAAATRNFER